MTNEKTFIYEAPGTIGTAKAAQLAHALERYAEEHPELLESFNSLDKEKEEVNVNEE